MVKTGAASTKEEAAKPLEVNNMLKKKNYKVQVALGLPKCSWKSAYATLNTGAGQNSFKLNTMNLPWKVAISDTKPQTLRSADAAFRSQLNSSGDREHSICYADWLVSERHRFLSRRESSCRHTLEYSVNRCERQVRLSREANYIFNHF